MGALEGTITNLLNIATALGLILCAFFLAVAGFKFMTSNGAPSGIESAKSAAFNACVGLALVLSARVIANIIAGAIVR